MHKVRGQELYGHYQRLFRDEFNTSTDDWDQLEDNDRGVWHALADWLTEAFFKAYTPPKLTVADELKGQWHKILAIVMSKYDMPEITLTMADLHRIDDESAVIGDTTSGDTLVLRTLNPEQIKSFLVAHPEATVTYGS